MAQTTINIDDARLDEFKSGFLVWCPIPTDDDGKPTMNFGEHIRAFLKQKLFSAYRAGKTKAAAESIIADETIIT